MNNAQMLVVPIAPLNKPEDWEAVERRREERMLELAREGWRPSAGYLKDEPQ